MKIKKKTIVRNIQNKNKILLTNKIIKKKIKLDPISQQKEYIDFYNNFIEEEVKA